MGCILSHFFTPISQSSKFSEHPILIQSFVSQKPFVSNLIVDSYVEKCSKCPND